MTAAALQRQEESVGKETKANVDMDALSEVSEYQPVRQSLLSAHTRSLVSSFATDDSSVWTSAIGGRDAEGGGGRGSGRG